MREEEGYINRQWTEWHNRLRDKQSLTNRGLHCPSCQSSLALNSPPPTPQLQTPKWKQSYLNYPIRTKESLYKKRDKRGEKGIPVMLVQALQYQNTACERGTAGRCSRSIAPGLQLCVVSERGWSFLPPTASWTQDSLTQFDLRSENTSVCL